MAAIQQIWFPSNRAWEAPMSWRLGVFVVPVLLLDIPPELYNDKLDVYDLEISSNGINFSLFSSPLFISHCQTQHPGKFFTQFTIRNLEFAIIAYKSLDGCDSWMIFAQNMYFSLHKVRHTHSLFCCFSLLSLLTLKIAMVMICDSPET